MKLLARTALASAAAVGSAPALLLEGAWPPAHATALRWSLDEAIDGRHAWIDSLAGELAQRVTCRGGPLSPAWLNALKLRYYLVRLLRLVAFFDEVYRLPSGETLELHLGGAADHDYRLVCQQLARRGNHSLEVVEHASSPYRRHGAARGTAPPNRWWRRAAGRWLFGDTLAMPETSPLAHDDGDSAPRVVLCGNRRILDSVCGELLERGCRVWWLYDRFCWGTWRHYRGRGVGQLLCNSSQADACAWSSALEVGPLVWRGVDLGPAVQHWLQQQWQQRGSQQTRMVVRMARLLAQVRATHLVLDEDATPLARAAAALAPSTCRHRVVVQHGAPGVRFGFAPLEADTICVWDEPSRQQLLRWGIDRQRIRVTGSVAVGALPPVDNARTARAARGRPEHWNLLLLATVPPRDDRPDAVELHLTQTTFDEMLCWTCAVARQQAASLTIQLHPRGAGAKRIREVCRQFPDLRVRLVRGGAAGRHLAEADVVLSMPSSAGIEAAGCGAPVVQLLPRGSGRLWSSAAWGLLGPVRSQRELQQVIAALRTGAYGTTHVCAVSHAAQQQRARRAARSVVDVLLAGTAENETVVIPHSPRQPQHGAPELARGAA